MKKVLWILTAILVAVSLLTAGVSAYTKPADVSQLNVVATANEVMPAPNAEKVLESRFLNMLNRNYVYGTDFESVNDIVDNSVVALLSLRESEESSYIAENYVADFIRDMYGIDGVELDVLAPESKMRDGYVYILPRGYCEYNHRIISVTENEDGSFWVTTSVEIMEHDDFYTEGVCKSLIVKNEASAYGYSIISSDIAEVDMAI